MECLCDGRECTVGVPDITGHTRAPDTGNTASANYIVRQPVVSALIRFLHTELLHYEASFVD